MDDITDWQGIEPWELESVIPLKSTKGKVKKTVEKITSLSPDTVKRLFPHLIVHLSQNRLGMKLRNALVIAKGID
jgi:hypothetical protein